MKTIVGVILRSRHPMFLFWGPELVQIYNDGYLPSFGTGKHPAAMGQRGRDCWQEIWPIIGPQIEDVMNQARASWNEDQLVPIFRNGRLEEVYWTYGYSAVIDEQGGVGGVLVVCTETTARMISERRSRTKRAIVERAAQATDSRSLLIGALDVLREAPEDVAFALAYEAGGDGFNLVRAVGLDDPRRIDALVRDRLRVLEIAHSQPEGRVLACDQVMARGFWPETVGAVYVAPCTSVAGERPSALLVLGLSPRLSFSEDYRIHLDQIAQHLGLALARIRAHEIQAAVDRERDNLLLQAPVATALLTGSEHVFQLANPLYLQMVGKNDIVGKSYRQAFPELRESPLTGILDRVFATGEPFATSELLVPLARRTDGAVEDRYFKFNLEPLRDQTARIYGMMAIAVDITEQVNARRVLERSNRERADLLEELENASRAKDEFLAMLGHELRNPLAPISTALQLMKLRGDVTTKKEQAVIERQVRHLTSLVDDLLDVAKITRGKVELRRSIVDISDVIAKAVEMASDLFEQRNHELRIDVAPERLQVSGDSVRLAQVVANLLTNAARYTNSGGKVTVSAQSHAGHVVIRVKDNGLGISADLRPRIFDLFIQGRRSVDRAQGGLGIGLTLVKNLVTLHAGSVAVHSDGEGHGSEFIVTLPAVGEGSAAVEVSPPQRPAVHGEISRRVLVVDDNADAADSLAEFLSDVGHQVAVAYSPVQALDIADRFKPHVAVLDIGLPVMDGYELAERLRMNASLAGCRFVALTGYGQAHDHARSAQGGFQHHLVKPIDLDRLTSIILSE